MGMSAITKHVVLSLEFRLTFAQNDIHSTAQHRHTITHTQSTHVRSVWCLFILRSVSFRRLLLLRYSCFISLMRKRKIDMKPQAVSVCSWFEYMLLSVAACGAQITMVREKIAIILIIAIKTLKDTSYAYVGYSLHVSFEEIQNGKTRRFRFFFSAQRISPRNCVSHLIFKNDKWEMSHDFRPNHQTEWVGTIPCYTIMTYEPRQVASVKECEERTKY